MRCGSVSGRFSRSLLILCFLLPACLWAAPSPAEMSDGELLEELSLTWQQQESRLTGLRSSLDDLNLTLQDLQTMQEEAAGRSKQLESSLTSVQADLESLATRSAGLESRVLSAQDSLRSTRSSLDELESSLTSLSEEARSLQTRNVWLTVLLVLTAGVAVTALVLD